MASVRARALLQQQWHLLRACPARADQPAAQLSTVAWACARPPMIVQKAPSIAPTWPACTAIRARGLHLAASCRHTGPNHPGNRLPSRSSLQQAVMAAVPLSLTGDTFDGADALVVIGPAPFNVPQIPGFEKILADAQAVDSSVADEVSLVVCPGAPKSRLVLAPTGPLNRDIDDVRRYADAAKQGFERALRAGAKTPAVLVTAPGNVFEDFSRYQEVAILSVLAANYVPLEAREGGAEQFRAKAILVVPSNNITESNLQVLSAIEAGRAAARDICGSDPERMAAPRVAAYIQDLFVQAPVTVKIEEDPVLLGREYPLLSAVARCSTVVERHRPRVAHLEYKGEGEIASTVFFVGKGITYDTGGADVKYGGHMAGMHRDKGGAAAVVGFFAVLARLRPKNIRVVGKLALVRNSIGADAYVADEIIKARSGVRVRVGNTDAEGRMVMTDLLCLAKEEALQAVNPRIFTIATLTGHVVRAFGMNYSAVMDNGPARKLGTAKLLFETGNQFGDPFEISTIRREDYEFNQSSYPTEDLVQCNSAPSTQTDRGHQLPAAFMAVASGVNKHGLDSATQIAYSHLDIAGSTKDWPEPVSGAPIPALTAAFILPALA
eukprot:m.227296 g.227296  ORF g.227296 m.227296 type:complete len:609 (+) comp11567_c0_seq1:63-1889(+)